MRPNPMRFVGIALSIAGVMLLAAPPASGAEGDDDTLKFTLDPVVVRPWFVDVDSDSSKFEEYRDMDSGMVLPLIRLRGETSDYNRTLDFEAFNASRADERYTLRYGNSGRYGIMLDYNVIPHRFGNDGTLLYSNSHPVSLRISDSIQQDIQNQIATQFAVDPSTVNFAFLTGLLQPFIDTAQSIDLSLDRKRARAKIDIMKLKRLSWTIDVKQETRQGNRPYGGSFGFNNAVEIPEPIDYRTTDLDFSGEWNGQRSGLRFGARVSRFDNMNPYVMYDNPFRIADSTNGTAYSAPGSSSIEGPASGRNTLAPDNTAGDIYLSGRAKLGSRGWFNGSVRYGMMSQDDRLLPYTTNTAITAVSNPAAPFSAANPANLPVENADTEVRLFNLSANAGMRFASKYSVQGRIRYYDYDNDSSQISFPGYVRFDAVWEAIPRITIPYDYTRESAGVEFGWDIVRSTHLAVSWDREMWERTFREIEDSDEDIFKLSVDHRRERLTIRGSVEHGDKSIDEYETEAQEVTFQNPSGINNQPGLRKYDEAARTYDAGTVTAIIMASDSINVTAGLTVRNEDYDESDFGLSEYDSTMYSAEIDYTPSENLTLFVFGHRTDAESFQRARQSGGTLSTNPQDDWELTLDEITDTWGLGLESRIAEVWTVTIRGQRSESDGNSDFFSPPGGNPNTARGFPEYDDNEWTVVSGRLGRIFSQNLSGGITYIREEFTTNRFQRDGLTPYVPGTLILNPNDADYNADILAVDLRVAF